MYRIKELRKQQGLTQNKLAELIGADSNLISRWETGKSKPISLYVQKLAQALGTSTDYLLGDTDDSTPSSTPIAVSVVNSASNENDTVPVRERSFTEKDRALVYVDGNKRFEFPPTPEGYAMFQRLLDKTTSVAV